MVTGCTGRGWGWAKLEEDFGKHEPTHTELLALARYNELTIRELREAYDTMRARAVSAENQLRSLKSTMASLETQLACARKHFQHVVIPDAPTEDMQPLARQSDFHCICGTVCLTDGTGHWCNNRACKHCSVVHSNKLG